MIDQERFYRCLLDEGVCFFTGVPDTLLNDFCLYVQEHSDKEKHVIAANEGNAVALAAGYQLATGGVPLVYMQNSGMGNAMNPLLSLAGKNLYGIPMILLIGWRGDPAVNDHPQHNQQGELTPVFLENLDIPYRVVESGGEEAFELARWAARTAKEMDSPVALIAKKGMFEKGSKEDLSGRERLYEMNREEAIKAILDLLPKETIFVATTGRASRELHALRELRGEGHSQDFLNVGAMGHASAIANGIALADASRQVVCLDGDSASIMHMGSLTTAPQIGLKNMLHIVLNNGVHESVGGQPSAGLSIDLTSIADGAGYLTIGGPVKTKSSLKEALEDLKIRERAGFIEVHIQAGMRQDMPPLKFDHQDLKKQIRVTLNS